MILGSLGNGWGEFLIVRVEGRYFLGEVRVVSVFFSFFICVWRVWYFRKGRR